MTCDIVIKSYPPDYGWLTYCLRSIQKYATGFRDVIVMLPRSHPLPLTKERVILMDVEESYMSQQVAKLNADLHTDADFVLHLDSDCVFTQPVTPETFMCDGKPRWLMTPWEYCAEAKLVWFHVMAKALQVAPDHEFMRRNGLMIPRFAYGAFRNFIERTHGLTMDAYAMSQPGREFSEFNVIGFYLWLYHHATISWHDTSELGVPDCPISQAWSWEGMSDQKRQELEMITA